MIDYHIHTHHSVDAEGSITKYCEQAVKLGLKDICITNHCELDVLRNDNLLQFDQHKQPFTREGLIRLRDEVMRAKELYKSSGLEVKFGIEVGYYDGVESRLHEVVDGIDFDFVLGSIHCLDHICIDSSKECEQYFEKHPVSELLHNYFHAIEGLIKSKLFDSVAHLDVYKKYGLEFYGEDIHTYPKEYIMEIFNMMVEKKIALEINTAGLRFLKEFYPSPRLMECARSQGVTLITIGSDCHRVEDLGKGIKDGLEYARSFGFNAVYGFAKRQPIELKI